MKLLALDASTQALSVAIIDSAAPNSARSHFAMAPRSHAQRLIPVARSLLTHAGWAWSDLDGLAFACGPGAFTGLRIAAGLIQGLAMGLGVEVVGIDTLRAVAARCLATDPADRVQVVQDARMGEVYTGLYARDSHEAARPLACPRVIAPATLEVVDGCARAGNGWALVAAAQGLGHVDVAIDAPHAKDVACLALGDFAAGRGRPAAEVLPVYVRDEVARRAP